MDANNRTPAPAVLADALRDLQSRLDRIESLALLGAKRTLDLGEAALYTGYSKGHLYRLTSAREIPHFKQGGRLFFDKAALDGWMTSSPVPTTEETAAEAQRYLLTHTTNTTKR